MPLLLHRAPRADLLVEGLAALLGTPLPDPFAPELVLVPARGIERWLSQQLSHRLGPRPGLADGVCAGVDFRSPRSLVAELLGTGEEDPWAPDALAWPVLAVLDECGGEGWARTLGLHLGMVADAAVPEEELELRRGRRWSVARRLAGLLSSYAVQRPALLAAWEAGEQTDGTGATLPEDLAWQPELWRRVLAHVGADSPVVRHADAVARLRAGDPAGDLPARISLFGHTRIPVTEVELLAALGEHREVHLWLPHPSAALWEALAGVRGVVPRSEDTSYAGAAHPLLAALGRDLRELQRSLAPVVTDVPAAQAVAEPPATLLGHLQRDIAANTTAPQGRVLAAGDRSVQVHACHGPARQVEVLREVLLGLLSDDPTLEPRDILVMCPDIEAYAPLITAAFGMAAAEGGPGADGVHHPGHQLRVMLADRELTQTNPLFAVAGRLLDLAGGRAEASRILDLLATDAVRRRFRFTEAELETVTDWVAAAGIRWGFEARHRAAVGLDGYVQNTWRFGLDRILAGVAVSDDADRFFGTTLPLDDVASTSIDLAGRLAECLDRLQRATDRLSGAQPVSAWLDGLASGIAELTDVAPGDEWQVAQLHRELAGLADHDMVLRIADVRALLSDRVAGRPSRASFRTGTLTVCTMTPMRSVPHRVVCLLGLDDGVFPRAGAVDGDDVLARTPCTGERDARSEDRQLLLDAVLAARETLVVTYTGAAATTGLPRPPAVPLQELLDALDATVPGAAAAALRRHPLQAFDPRGFEPAAPFSFDRQALAGARATTAPRLAPPALRELRLPPRPGDVELTELVAFFKSPCRDFLRRRLDITLPDDGEDATDAIPVELDVLQQWQVGDRLLRDLLAGRTREDALARAWRRGVLPPGRLGWELARRLADQAEPVAALAEALRQGREPRAADVTVDLGGGRLLTGTVTGLYGDRLVVPTFSRLKPKHWLDVWLPLLALSAGHPGGRHEAVAVGRGAKGYQGRPDEPTARVAWSARSDAAALLADLVEIFDTGQCEPLPLPVETGHAWVVHQHRPRDERIRKVAYKWEGDYGEHKEPEHVRVWGPGLPFEDLLTMSCDDAGSSEETSRFATLATRLWGPMLEGRR